MIIEAQMARNIDTSLLRAFVAVAETSGMTTAANLLNLTQAAVSQQIKRLEDAFEAPLFERERKGLRLTSAGERLFAKAKRMLALNDDIWAEMTTPIYEGQVRLGIPYDLVHSYLPPVLKSFSKAYPKIEISLECEVSVVLRQELEAGKIDLALTTEIGCGPGGESLVVDRLVWAGARGGSAHRQRPLPISLGNENCAFRPSMFKALGDAEIPWRPVSQVNNFDTMNATVQTDLAVMALLASTIPSHFEILPPSAGLPPLPTFSINLYESKTGITPVAQELARHIREGCMTRPRQAAA
jgi:DNA-binding transcriptional LysR family regulator